MQAKLNLVLALVIIVSITGSADPVQPPAPAATAHVGPGLLSLDAESPSVIVTADGI
jgi:hypothetical protein